MITVKDFLEKPIDDDELNKALYRIAYEEEKIENKEIEKINDNKNTDKHAGKFRRAGN